MHGRRKVKTTEDKIREKKERDRERSKEYSQLSAKAFELRGKAEHTTEALKVTEKLLSVNADCYTMWNYRREILETLAAKLPEAEMKDLYKAEMSWLERCLGTWPKSYWIWHQRKWISALYTDTDWNRELTLCGTMHKADQRNFHCWNYRRFAASKANASHNSELNVTMKLIEADPSNYSAWHYRSVLLPKAFDGQELSDKISDEFELIKQALWTDPADQSAWLYHHWLVGERKSRDPTHVPQTLEEQLAGCEELLEAEPDSKWALLTTVFLMLDRKSPADKDLLLKRLGQLEVLDDKHQAYYKELSHKIAC